MILNRGRATLSGTNLDTISRTARLSHRTMTTSAAASPFAPKSNEKLTLASTVRLMDGKPMPRFGLGAWDMFGAQEVTGALQSAVDKIGYRHIDTAQYYRNEDHVGRFANEVSSVPRSELFLTTKTFTKGSGAYDSIQRTLDKAGLAYWDLVLIHAPDGGAKARKETWDALSKLVEQGKAKSIGVSNYGSKHLEELRNERIKPVVNQIECHPFFAQRQLRKDTESHGIVVQAYCPLARNQYDGDETLNAVAKRNGKTVAQVLLRWSIQEGMVPLPKSSNPGRQKENADALIAGWSLSAEDMAELSKLDRGDSGAIESQTMSQNAP